MLRNNKPDLSMALANKIWNFCLIFLLIFAATTATAADKTNMTTTEITITTTTVSSGTITIKLWIIYAVIVPILGIATIVALLFLRCWLCNKRHVAILPKTQLDKKRIINDLNNDNETTAEPFDHFVVSHESRKISKKPKKAINCLVKKDHTPPVKQDTEPGIERLNKAIDIATEERNMADDTFQDDVESENAFNHLKEESAPKEHIRKLEQPHGSTNRSESLNNTFKPEYENAERVGISHSKTLINTSQMIRSRRRRRPKESAIKRNMKLIKSKLNRSETEETTDETDDKSTSAVYTSSEEESVIDPSFVPSGDEDVITDDEASSTDHDISRHSKRHKIENEISHDTDKDTSKSRIGNADNTHEFNHDHSPTADVVTQKIIRRNAKKTRGKETFSHHKSSKDSNVFTQKEEVILQNPTEASRKESSRISPPELSPDIEPVQETNEGSKTKLRKTVTKSLHEHVQRQGPLATSSFKSSGEEKTDACEGANSEKQTDTVIEIKHYSDTNMHDFVLAENGVSQKSNESEEKTYENYKEFDKTLMQRGKINLNRSVSFNETDVYKDEMKSIRRKRKYQSLRQTKKESVFDALRILDKAPKKSILKKSDGLHFYDKCKVDTEDYNTNLASNDNGHVLSKTNLVNLQKNEINGENSANVSTMKDKTDLEPNRQYVFNKTLRNKTLEPNDRETLIFVVSRDAHDENDQDKFGIENNDTISQIVSSNLLGNISSTATLDDADILDFSKQQDRLSSELNSLHTDAAERLSPVLTQISPNKQKSPVKGNINSNDSKAVKSNEKTNSISFSDSGSDPNIKICSNVKSCDEKEQGTIRTDSATDLYDEHEVENIARSRMSNEVEPINIQTSDKETIILPIKYQSSLEVQEQSQLSCNLTLKNNEHLMEESVAKRKDETKLLQDADIYVSERGLLHSKELETHHSKIASSTLATQVIDQNIKQGRTSKLNLTKPVYTSQNVSGFADIPIMTPVVAFSEENLKDDVTEKHEIIQAQIPMFIRTQTLNDGVTDNDDKPQETRNLQAERPKNGFADIQMPTSLRANHASSQVSDKEKHKDVASTILSGNEPKHNLFVQTKRSKTPILTSEGLEMPPPDIKSTPHKIERPRSNPLFDHIGVETLPVKTERSVNNSNIYTSNQPSPTSHSEAHSAITKKKARASSENWRMVLPSPKIQKSLVREEQAYMTDLTSSNAYSKQQRSALRNNETMNQLENPHQFWTENTELHKKPVKHQTMPEVPFSQTSKLKRANVLNTVVKDENKTSERSNAFSKDATGTDGRLKPDKESNESIGPVLRNRPVKARSKTPSVETERSPVYPLEHKRSKTPLPVPTYIRNNTEASLKKISVDELGPKQQTHHMESFSRNFQHFPIDRRQFTRSEHQRSVPLSSVRNKRSNTVVFGRHGANANTLLNRRKKEDNTLGGRVNSMKPSERERPKSAMSLRSAPWSTTMETVRSIPRNIKARNENIRTPDSFVYYSNDNVTSEKARLHAGMDKQSYMSHMGPDNILNVKHTNFEFADSDSELEEFFANPDAEVLQLGN